MLTELPPRERAAVRPLFESFPGLRGCVDAALDGRMGRVWAGAALARVALIHLDFFLLAGEADALEAEEAARMVERDGSIVTPGPSWEPVLRRVWGERLHAYTRVEFEAPASWDRARLRGFIDALPDGLAVRRITREDAARFAELADSLVYNFDSLDAFIAHGAGYGIEQGGRFVAGCSSFAISNHSLEFEIQTHEDHRRRGLASATAAAMIAHCIERGLEPSWDAHNEMSAALATKLGFVHPQPYIAYELRPRIGLSS